MLRAAYASLATFALVPLQDLLQLGPEARMNTPSRSDGNWSWRYHPGALKPEIAQALAALTDVADRVTGAR
jgi:4-alpha-glucanotransferase